MSSTEVAGPIEQLKRIAYLMERVRSESRRTTAYRKAAATLRALPDGELERRIATGTVTELAGIGPSTGKVIKQAAAGQVSDKLAELEAAAEPLPFGGGSSLRAALRGDLHLHSEWSDGGSPIRDMAQAAIALGHSYMALTDHSPRLTVARGLTAERLRRQLDVVARLNDALPNEYGEPFRILTGIEVDILEDGSLDQEEELLGQLDVVVASVHSKLRMPAKDMTPRMVAAIANPHMDVLGHCTGRLITGERGLRGESEFDAEIVFEACRQFDVAVEINSRPERLDPPKRLLALAFEMGCAFSVDTDAHAPGQLEWQGYGCARAEEAGIPPERIINTREHPLPV
ncbi:PHP domain-containing protein [Flindersiella endophytica]